MFLFRYLKPPKGWAPEARKGEAWRVPSCEFLLHKCLVLAGIGRKGGRERKTQGAKRRRGGRRLSGVVVGWTMTMTLRV